MIGAPSVKGVIPRSIFVVPLTGFEPEQAQFKQQKYQGPNQVGHLDLPHTVYIYFPKYELGLISYVYTNLSSNRPIKMLAKDGTQREPHFQWNMGLKPIFHWELGLRWLPNANEINTKNMKCTWPTRKCCLWNPMQPIFY